MSNKVCVGIHAENSEEMLKKLQELNRDHDFFELRFDSMTHLNQIQITSVLEAVDSDVIATIRSEKEGGNFKGNLDEQAKLVEACIEAGADYVDAELTLLEHSTELIKKLDPHKTLVSYHDFAATPPDAELNRIVKRMEKLMPQAIYKIACMARSMNDVVRLTEFLKTMPKGRAVIIAMSEKGQLLRLLAPGLGAFTTFASASNSPNTLGQMYYKTMKQLINAMEVTDGGK